MNFQDIYAAGKTFFFIIRLLWKNKHIALAFWALIYFLDFISPRILNLLFCLSVNSSLESNYIEILDIYKFSSIIGSSLMIFIFWKSEEINENRMRNIRRLLFAVLAIITLISFSMLSFSAFNNPNENYIATHLNVYLGILFIFLEVMISILIFLISSLFEGNKNILISNYLITHIGAFTFSNIDHNSRFPLSFFNIEKRCFISSEFQGHTAWYNFYINPPTFKLPDSKSAFDDSNVKGLDTSLSECVMETTISIVMTFIISIIPFIMDFFFGFVTVDSEALGEVVGLNDFYLIPAAFGGLEVAIQVSANTAIKYQENHLVHFKKLLICAMGLVALISFSLFSFGCNEYANHAIQESSTHFITYLIAIILSVLVMVLTISLKYIEFQKPLRFNP